MNWRRRRARARPRRGRSRARSRLAGARRVTPPIHAARQPCPRGAAQAAAMATAPSLSARAQLIKAREARGPGPPGPRPAHLQPPRVLSFQRFGEGRGTRRKRKGGGGEGERREREEGDLVFGPRQSVAGKVPKPEFAVFVCSRVLGAGLAGRMGRRWLSWGWRDVFIALGPGGHGGPWAPKHAFSGQPPTPPPGLPPGSPWALH